MDQRNQQPCKRKVVPHSLERVEVVVLEEDSMDFLRIFGRLRTYG